MPLLRDGCTAAPTTPFDRHRTILAHASRPSLGHHMRAHCERQLQGNVQIAQGSAACNFRLSDGNGSALGHAAPCSQRRQGGTRSGTSAHPWRWRIESGLAQFDRDLAGREDVTDAYVCGS